MLFETFQSDKRFNLNVNTKIKTEPAFAKLHFKKRCSKVLLSRLGA